MDKNLILIEYLKAYTSRVVNNKVVNDYLFKAEYSTNDNDLKVVVVTQRPTEKQVLWCGHKIFDAFQIEIFGDSMRSEKAMANKIGDLIGDNITITYENKKYQIMFMQISNPQSIMYEDIRRIGYSMILRTIINEI